MFKPILDKALEQDRKRSQENDVRKRKTHQEGGVIKTPRSMDRKVERKP
ncbi:hypothetical protein L915_10568 [Phytophthora nicotianae]|uniref:Uncharacterized protein n=1 Tax=Phytophthora nicotianae TaxID=4792 RepID=W2GN95_PHYNI|nr:hypothetical protein L915_10568 [Phytophthora nicotianae]